MLLYLWEMDFITTQCMCFCLNIFIFIVKHLKIFLIWLSISSFSLNHSSSLSLSVQIICRHFHWRDKGLTTYVFWPFLNLANWCSKWIMFSIIPCNRVYIIKWIKVWQVCQSRFASLSILFTQLSLFQLLPISSYKHFFHFPASYDCTFH